VYIINILLLVVSFIVLMPCNGWNIVAWIVQFVADSVKKPGTN